MKTATEKTLELALYIERAFESEMQESLLESLNELEKDECMRDSFFAGFNHGINYLINVEKNIRLLD